MTKVVNKSGQARAIAATGDVVEAGASVDVPADLAASLCEQVDVWAKPPTAKKSKKAASSADTSEED